ncbi:IBR domain-containing protein [Hirsutella rhossiliensis]|uniref:RBR-type E3 ubiquitin transferase n=1 Tax=Hirsutella rhossiliensis TaxID=111463 RepID=A0A9P8SIK4_9HYPO|nr:IBR domain-containing protein [Hirsutella rhossiliensis]KAH0964308.1 IBR domain-containing protein [Hirsutella rhossiliensis]
MDEACQPPELSDALYSATVLQLPADKSEDHLDLELLARAHALGIRASLSSVSHYRRPASVALSESCASSSQEQLFSTASDGSASTYLTPHSSIIGPPSPDVATADQASSRHPKLPSFSPYEKFLAHRNPAPDSTKSTSGKSFTTDSSAQSIFSVSTRKGLSGFRSRMTLRKKSTRSFEPSLICYGCRTEFRTSASLHILPCGHSICNDCLKLKISEASGDESKMPPRCCLPVPAAAIQRLLEPAAQETFLRAVVQFSTPMESRIFCTGASCGEFIPRRKHVDPKAPFTATCHKCHTRVCTICKRDAHPIGKDCPEDLEVAASPEVGDRPSRKRCYKCRSLVENTRDWSHLTCACKAQFCSLCGGVWDSTVGCPNICSSEEEGVRRRDSDDGGSTTQDVLRDAAEAERRSAQHPDVKKLQLSLQQELQRSCDFMAETRSSILTRHSLQRVNLLSNQTDQSSQIKEKHVATAAQLEDRQITEEMELRASLEQSERTIKVRIKHMEAYCEGLGRNPSGHEMPPRVVTEQNLRDLGHQYNLRDDMERQHQSKINMMRDRQANRMEELLQRQAEELQQLTETHQAEKRELDETMARDEEALNRLFDVRNARLAARWNLAIEVLCKELEDKDGVRYAPVSPPSWPDAEKTHESMVPQETVALIS